MALHFPANDSVWHSSCDSPAFDMESDCHKCIMKHIVNADDDDRSSVCSTNIHSKTPTLESLPVLSDDLLDNEDLDDVLEQEPVPTDKLLEEVTDKLLEDESARRNQHVTQSTLGKSEELQAAVDRIFRTGAASLLDVGFSFAIADAQMEGCPLLGCSSALTSLCGYEMADIVGFNCSFLVNPVLSWEQVDQVSRRQCREFCKAAKDGKDYKMTHHELHDEWLPEHRPVNELITVQTSTHKDGSLFNSMFLMRTVRLGDCDDERRYIIALQSEILGRRSDFARLRQHLEELDKSMAVVEKILSQDFVLSSSVGSQCSTTDEDE
mmetsp:Transcript_4545/g.7852  ORF Transcript_4545/g.7852 Transcript_4545/m.7852 type:complete len:323 (+) Transcript_4545:81-1049(+)